MRRILPDEDAHLALPVPVFWHPQNHLAGTGRRLPGGPSSAAGSRGYAIYHAKPSGKSPETIYGAMTDGPYPLAIAPEGRSRTPPIP